MSNEEQAAFTRAGCSARDDDCRRRVVTLNNSGARLLEEGRPLEAIEPLQEALELDTDNVSAIINLGGAYVMAGRPRQAVSLLQRAAELEPDNAMVWVNLAAALLGRPPHQTPEGQERAIQAYRRALELDPHSPNVSYSLGLIHKDRGELETALAYFRAAVRTNAGDRDASHWIAMLQAELLYRTGEAPAGEQQPRRQRRAMDD